MTLEKNNEKKHGNFRWGVVLFFSLFLIYGLLTYDDYGISWDEPVQRHHSLVTYNALALRGEEYKTDTIDTSTIEDLSTYGANYGVILQLPTVLIEHIFDFELTYEQVFHIRHLYNFLWFFAASIFFYLSSMMLTKNGFLSLAGTLFLILCPRILADSFYNIKDMLCLSTFCISIYFGLRLIQKMSLRDVLLFCVFAALCTTARIVGGVIVAGCVLVILIKSIPEHNFWKNLKFFLLIGILFCGGFILLTPKSWTDIWNTIVNTIRTFSNYTYWDASVYYLGEQVHATELPWHYLFVWIIFTVPVTYLVFSVIGTVEGVVKTMKSIRQKQLEVKTWQWIFLEIVLVIPIAYVVVLKPVLYNGWRHFYFIYPVLMLLAVLGLETVASLFRGKKILRYLLSGWLGAVFVILIIWIGRNHPYEYVYFNPLVRNYAFKNMELDYWCVSEEDAMRYIQENEERGQVNVYSSPNYAYIFNEDGQCYLNTVDSANAADYVIWGIDDFTDSYFFDEVYAITVDGYPIRKIYKRTYSTLQRFEVEENDTAINAGINGIEWNLDVDNGYVTYSGTLKEVIPTDMIALVLNEEVIELESVQLEVSGDGENWYSLWDAPRCKMFDNGISAECMVHELKYIRVSGPEKTLNNFEVILAGYTGNIASSTNTENLSIQNIIDKTSSSSDIRNAIDGNPGTRWTVSNQAPGMEIELELNDCYEYVSEVHLDLGTSPWDYPRNLEIYASADGENWNQLEASTTDNERFYFSPTDVRYLRLVLGNVEALANTNWSIYEINIYTRLQ